MSRKKAIRKLDEQKSQGESFKMRKNEGKGKESFYG